MSSPRRPLHPELSPAERRRLLERGAELFEAGSWFAAHEAFEEIWRSTTPEPRDLFQGLVQVAAGLHHFVDRGRPAPARRLLARGRKRLESLPTRTLGLDLAALLGAIAAWEAWLVEAQGAPPPWPRLAILRDDEWG